MNVTLSLLSGTGGASGDAPLGATGALGTDSKSLSAQTVGAANPFALLLSGQLRMGGDAGAQGLPVALVAGKLPGATAEDLPLPGKPLPEGSPSLAQSGAGADGDGAVPAVSLLPLQLSAVVPQAAQSDLVPAAPLDGLGDGELTLNIMKLALGERSQEQDGRLPAVKQPSDEQSLLRLMQAGMVRMDPDRAAAALQAEAGQLTNHGDGKGQASSAVTTATPVTADAARIVPDMQQRTAAAPAAQATLSQPLGKPGWDQDLGGRLMWMSNQQLDSAQLRLNPAHLGPLEVRLSVHHDQTANVAFLSNHAQVREAVEAALPRLREMLADSGVNLTDANVSSHSHQGGAREQSAPNDTWSAKGDVQSDATSAEEVARSTVIGLVDYFA